MRVKAMAAIVAIKVAVLVVWFITSTAPLSGGVVSAKVPPPERQSEMQGPGDEAAPLPEKGLLEAIRRKEDELKTREDELNERMRHLAGVKKDIDTRVKRLQALIKDFNAVKERIDRFNNDKARRLVKIYESMAPQDAALRIERLDDKMAASILGSMREKIAGKILGFVNVDKSVKISRVLKKEIR
jgi:flagellar motility protein MotE (MotC chaperone)